MIELTSNPIFGFSLCIAAYIIAVLIRKRFDYAILNPILISTIIIIAILQIFDIPLTNFMNGAGFVSMFLAPATASLALSMYRQLDAIKKNWLPILVGSIVGAVTAVLSVYLLCIAFKLPQQVTISLLPKSITIAFATNLSQQLGGIIPLTSAGVSITGIGGAILAPYLVKWFRINDPIAAGLGIGASSHMLGTAKAVEMGEVEGTVSGIAVGLCGIATVILLVIFRF